MITRQMPCPKTLTAAHAKNHLPGPLPTAHAEGTENRPGRRTPFRLRVPWALAWLGVALFSLPGTVQAHVRWFVEDQPGLEHEHFSVDLATIWVVAGALFFVAVACTIDLASWSRRAADRFTGFYQLPKGTEWRIIGFLTGLMLIANATMQVILAPNLIITDRGMLVFGMVAQLIVGLLLVGQVTFLVSGLLIVLLLPVTAVFVPLSRLANYLFEFASLGVALMLVGPALSLVDRRVFRLLHWEPDRFAAWPLPLIRLGVGLTLAILAFDEKLLHPQLSMKFLKTHPWNFMPQLGFSGFSDLNFVFAAGVAELTFGLLLLSGIATRFTTAALSVFFLTTLFVLGPAELVGHAPLFGIAFLLVVQGSGAARLRLRTAQEGGKILATQKAAA